MPERKIAIKITGENVAGPAFEKVDSDLKNIGDSADHADRKTGNFFTNMASTAGGFITANVLGRLADGLGGIASKMFSYNADMESYTTTFAVFFQNAEKGKGHIIDFGEATQLANTRMGELTKFAAQTPFELPQVVSAGKVLQAFGIYSEDNLRRFGNAASAAGINIDEMSNYMGKLKAGQYGEVFQRLAELGVVTREQLEMKGLTFDKGGAYTGSADKAMSAVTEIFDENYSGMMDKQSKTFTGMLSNFSDFGSQLIGKIGAPIFDKLSTLMSGALEWFGKPETAAMIDNIANLIGNVLGGALDLAGKGFGFLVDGAKYLVGWFGNIKSAWDEAGLGGAFEAFFDMLKDMGGQIIGKLGDLGGMLLKWIGSVDWGAVASGLWNAFTGAITAYVGFLQDFYGAIWNAIKGIDWGALWRGIGDVAGAITGWLGEQWSKIDWGKVWGAIGNFGEALWKGAGDIAGATGSWLADQWKRLDWGQMFGSMGEGLGSLWESISQWFIDRAEDLWPLLTEWGKKIYDWIMDQAATSSEKFGVWWKSISDWFGTIPAKIGEALSGWGKSIGDWIGGLFKGGEVAQAAGNLTTGLGTALEDRKPDLIGKASGMLKSMLYAAGIIVAATAIQVGIDLVTGIGKGIASLGGWLSGQIGNVLGGLWKTITDWFQQLWDHLVGHSVIPELMQKILDWFLWLPGQIGTALSNLWTTVTDWFGKIKTSIGEILGNIGTLITGFFDDPKAGLTALWNIAWTGISNIVDTVFGPVKGTIDNILGFIGGLFEGFINAEGTGIKAIWTSGFDAIKWTIDNVFAPIGGAIQAVFDVVGPLFGSFLNGEKTGITVIWSTAFNSIKWVIDNVFKPVGTTIQTLLTGAGGILEMFTTAIGSEKDGTGFVGAWTGAWKTISDLLAIGGTAWNNIVGGIRGIQGAIETFTKDAIGGLLSKLGELWDMLSRVWPWGNVSPPAPTSSGPPGGGTSGYDASAGYKNPAPGYLLYSSAPWHVPGDGGVDLAGRMGDPLVAIANGVVTGLATGYNGGWGNTMRLWLTNGMTAIYHHIMDGGFLKGYGQRAGQGEPVALMGSTGHSTGPHVHFSMENAAGSQVNVLDYIPLALGGLVTQPTFALMAENEPEIVIPLSKVQGGLGQGVVNNNTYYQLTANYKQQDERTLMDEVRLLRLAGAAV